MKHSTVFKRSESGSFFVEKDERFPNTIYLVSGNVPVFNAGNSHYVYIHEASKNACLEICKGPTFPLVSGSIFKTSQNEKFRLRNVAYGLVIKMKGINDIFQINPFVEKTGRLKYIDGCTDTLILQPVVQGLPCLSTLYFPEKTIQTQHTHPSFRIGMVVSGNGICKTPDGKLPMNSGDLIVVHQEGLHSFETQNDTMTIVSFHPDSDFGPQDLFHPMLNRTIVEGQPAFNHPQILTP